MTDEELLATAMLLGLTPVRGDGLVELWYVNTLFGNPHPIEVEQRGYSGYLGFRDRNKLVREWLKYEHPHVLEKLR